MKAGLVAFFIAVMSSHAVVTSFDVTGVDGAPTGSGYWIGTYNLDSCDDTYAAYVCIPAQGSPKGAWYSAGTWTLYLISDPSYEWPCAGSDLEDGFFYNSDANHHMTVANIVHGSDSLCGGCEWFLIRDPWGGWRWFEYCDGSEDPDDWLPGMADGWTYESRPVPESIKNNTIYTANPDVPAPDNYMQAIPPDPMGIDHGIDQTAAIDPMPAPDTPSDNPNDVSDLGYTEARLDDILEHMQGNQSLQLGRIVTAVDSLRQEVREARIDAGQQSVATREAMELQTDELLQGLDGVGYDVEQAVGGLLGDGTVEVGSLQEVAPFDEVPADLSLSVTNAMQDGTAALGFVDDWVNGLFSLQLPQTLGKITALTVSWGDAPLPVPSSWPTEVTFDLTCMPYELVRTIELWVFLGVGMVFVVLKIYRGAW